MTKDEAISRLMYTSRPVLLEMCTEIWNNCVYSTNGSVTPNHLQGFGQAQLVNWWITFFEWNEESSTWEDNREFFTIH